MVALTISLLMSKMNGEQMPRAMPNITRTFGVQPPELTQSQILCADSADYLLGGSLVMQNGRIDKLLFDGGYARAMETGSTTDRFLFYYYNKDHLGNNREVVDAKARFHQVTSYYPFGAPYADAAALLGTDHQPYKYNGKELDLMHGLNTYDYGARQYDPILARWDRVDPLCEKYYEVSPYAYCGNNPVNAIDPNGMDIWDVDNKGNIVKTETQDYDMIRIYNDSQDKGPSIRFDYGTITHQTIKYDGGLEYELFQINGDENGRNVFEMLAQQTDVEWTIAQMGKSGDANIITTSHDVDAEYGFSDYMGKNFKEGMMIRDITHNHPAGNTYPSYDIKNNRGDIPFAKSVTNKTKQNPTFHIYTLFDGNYGYIEYGPNSQMHNYILNGPSIDEIICKSQKH